MFSYRYTPTILHSNILTFNVEIYNIYNKIYNRWLKEQE